MLGYIDCHNHLQDRAFDEHHQAVIDLATQHNVHHSVVNGTSPEDWDKVMQLGQEYEHVIPCFGLHPWFVNTVKTETWQEELRDLLSIPRSGVGEFGLDGWKQGITLEQQIPVFRFQWALAAEIHRPAMIHCLKAWGLLLEEIHQAPTHPTRFMLHGFGGPEELIAPLVAAGAYFSVAGNVLDPRRTKAHNALRKIPQDRLLVETDAPDMPPPLSFQRISPSTSQIQNQPANLPLILAGLANLRNESEATLTRAVYQNSCRFLEGLLP